MKLCTDCFMNTRINVDNVDGELVVSDKYAKFYKIFVTDDIDELVIFGNKYFVCEKNYCYRYIHNQPERSKREDSLVCCEILNKLKDIFQDHKLLDVVREEYKNFIKEYEMRCSEHCGNTVRGK